MQTSERRSTLSTSPNPDMTLDYIISLSGTIQTHIPPIPHSNVSITLYYVPDREIAMPEPWRNYLDILASHKWETLEELAVTVLADIKDQLIPRWAELSIISLTEASQHSILLNENQPGWSNPSLLSAIERSRT
jgi:7-cyano-7-deazaguanine reductase